MRINRLHISLQSRNDGSIPSVTLLTSYAGAYKRRDTWFHGTLPLHWLTYCTNWTQGALKHSQCHFNQQKNNIE